MGCKHDSVSSQMQRLIEGIGLATSASRRRLRVGSAKQDPLQLQPFTCRSPEFSLTIFDLSCRSDLVSQGSQNLRNLNISHSRHGSRSGARYAGSRADGGRSLEGALRLRLAASLGGPSYSSVLQRCGRSRGRRVPKVALLSSSRPREGFSTCAIRLREAFPAGKPADDKEKAEVPRGSDCREPKPEAVAQGEMERPGL